MKMHPDSVPKTAFRCHLGMFEYTRVPFGVTNGPATFQRMVRIVLSGIDPRRVFNYLDDIVVLAEDWEMMKKLLKQLFDRFTEVGL